MVDWSAGKHNCRFQQLSNRQHRQTGRVRLAHEKMPCDGGLVSSNSVVGGSSSPASDSTHTNRLAHERVPCDGGLVSSNSVVGGTSSHVADVPPLKIHECFGVHGVVA